MLTSVEIGTALPLTASEIGLPIIKVDNPGQEVSLIPEPQGQYFRTVSTDTKFLQRLDSQTWEPPYCTTLLDNWHYINGRKSPEEYVVLEQIPLFTQIPSHTAPPKFFFLGIHPVLFKARGFHSGIFISTIEGEPFCSLVSPLVIGITPEGFLIFDYIRYKQGAIVEWPGIGIMGKDLDFEYSLKVKIHELLQKQLTSPHTFT